MRPAILLAVLLGTTTPPTVFAQHAQTGKAIEAALTGPLQLSEDTAAAHHYFYGVISDARIGLESQLAKEHAGDYRWEGLAIGAATLGIVMAILGGSVCSSTRESRSEHCTRTTVSFGIAGAVAGGVVGGLIGAGIKKPEKAEAPR